LWRGKAPPLSLSKLKIMTIAAKKVGREDYMGRAWYSIFIDGKVVMKNGIIEKWHALSVEHAIACYKQFN
jgi:hypothetical protein